MMKPMMHGGAMMGNGMVAQKGNPTASNPQMQMLEKRVDMMQMMMQMMMDQQAMTPPAK